MPHCFLVTFLLFAASWPVSVAYCAENNQSLFDGTTLTGWKQTDFDHAGTAGTEKGHLVVRKGKPMSGLTWQGEFPKTNYEVTLEAKRIAGGDFFCGLTFPVGHDFCSLIVGGWGGGLVGLSSLDGRDASENETTIYDQFEDGRWYKIRLLVTDERIKAWIDDRRYVHVVRRHHEFSVRHEVESSRPFGIATYQTTAAFRNLQLRRFKPALSHPGSIHAELNISYARTDDSPQQQLDMYLPSQPKRSPLPVVVFIADAHGDASARRRGLAWLEPMIASGQYVGVTVGYRPLSDAKWTAPIHDCKAAIRWIRAHAEHFDLDKRRIGIMGRSAGGQLAALLGTSGNVKELNGDLGDANDKASDVSCAVNLAGPSDLTLLTAARRDQGNEAIADSYGGLSKDTARRISASSYITSDDPPFLLVHGTRDEVVPYAQSRALCMKLRAAGVSTTLITVSGGNHQDIRPSIVQRFVAAFFEKHLLKKNLALKDEVINVK